jgi:hypothetical protein
MSTTDQKSKKPKEDKKEKGKSKKSMERDDDDDVVEDIKGKSKEPVHKKATSAVASSKDMAVETEEKDDKDMKEVTKAMTKTVIDESYIPDVYFDRRPKQMRKEKHTVKAKELKILLPYSQFIRVSILYRWCIYCDNL